MQIYDNILEIIGNTPLVRVASFENNNTVCVKLEKQNPAGSAKDRAALEMIRQAEKSGDLKKGSVIIEPTSGNTGVGLAMAASILGYSVILTMPDTMSEERRALLKAYGAKLVLTDGKLGMSGAIQKANQLAAEIENSFIPSQFDNKANANAHYKTTGPEIWRDTDGKIDIFIAGVGTGGTITGVGRYLKQKNPDIKIIAVEPKSSAVLSGHNAGAHAIQGIGAGFVPSVLDTEIYDEIITVENESALEMGRFLAKNAGMLVGISSGAAAFAAKTVAKRCENKGKVIVALLADTGERYLSTQMFKGD